MHLLDWFGGFAAWSALLGWVRVCGITTLSYGLASVVDASKTEVCMTNAADAFFDMPIILSNIA